MPASALKTALREATRTRRLSPEFRHAVAHGAKTEMARRSLYAFLKQAIREIEPGLIPLWNWHIEAFCFHVQSMLEGWLVANGRGTPAMRRRVIAQWAPHGLTFEEHQVLVQNMILNLAPITMKSRILMVVAPAWVWLHAPDFELCAISGVDDNVKRDSNAHKELVSSPWYRKTFEIKWNLNKKKDSVDYWENTAGGSRRSKPMLGGFTGMHVDGIFLDDPDDAFRVFSEPLRKAVQGKWRDAIKNRVKQPDISIRIAIQQRVHVDDWTSAQVSKGIWSPEDRMAWAWVVMPLHYGKGPEDAPTVSPFGWSDPRQVANDNMHPARFSDAFIADEIRDKGPEGFEAQYNQNAQSLDGGMIKRASVRFFRIEDEPITTRPRPLGCGLRDDGTEEPAFVLRHRTDRDELDLDWLVISIDASFGSESPTASACGIMVVGGQGMLKFLFDDRTDIMSVQAMYDAVAKTLEAWPCRKALVELKAAGSSVVNDLRKRLNRGDIRWPNGQRAIVEIVEIKIAPHDSKESRAAAMAPSWSAGLWHVLEGAPWLYPKVIAGGRVADPGAIGEICTFPKSKRNDRIDCLSQVDGYYRDTGDAKRRWRAMSR